MPNADTTTWHTRQPLRPERSQLRFTVHIQPGHVACDTHTQAPDGETMTAQMESKDIGYKGRPITTLSRDELICALTELAQAVVDCSATHGDCRRFIAGTATPETFNDR